MSSKNVETLRAAHKSWNKRDFAGVIDNAASKLTYTDHARALTLSTREKFREWTEGWAKAFSDCHITNPNTPMRETLSSPSSPSKAPTMGHSVQ